MRKFKLAVMASALLSFGAAAQSNPATSVVGSRVVGESRYDVSATVETVDQRSRQVLLKREDGSFLTFTAGPEIQNLAQVQAGDVVQATVIETLRLSLTRGEAPVDGFAEGVAVAPEGGRPGVAEFEAARISGLIETVNENERTIHVRAPDGFARQVSVPNNVNFARIRPGDHVVVSLLRRAAVVVRPASAR